MEKRESKSLGQKENYDLDAEYFLAEDEKGNLIAKTKEELLQMQKEGKILSNIREAKGNEKPKNKEEAKEITRTANIAKSLGIPKEQILNVIQIKDRETKTAVTDKDKRNSEIYTIKLNKDSAGRGSYDWIAVEALPNRFLPKGSRRRKGVRTIK